MLGWLKALPIKRLQVRSVLSVVYAHVLLSSDVFEGVEERLRDAERWLNAPTMEMVVVDQAAFRCLGGSIGIARTGMALARGNVPQTMTYAQQALDLAPNDDHLTRGGAAGFLGLASWTRGDLAAAHHSYAEGIAILHKAGNIAESINGTITVAAMRRLV